MAEQRIARRRERAAPEPPKGKPVSASALFGRSWTSKPRSSFQDVLSYIHGMKKDPWLAIAQIALIRMISNGKWEIVNEKTSEKLPKGADAPAVVKLFQKPNKAQRWRQFTARLMIHRNIAGNAYVFQGAKSLLGTPTELWLLEPQLVKPIPDELTFQAGWTYNVGGTPLVLSMDQVLHFDYLPDPDDVYRGVGIVGLAETHFNISTSMEEWIWSLFVNGAIPDGILTTDGAMDPETYDRLLREFEDRFGTPRKAHRPMVLEKGSKYERGSSPQELDFNEGTRDRRITTLALAGVPPILAGLTDGLNFASAYIQSHQFIQHTYEPTASELEEGFNEIIRLFGPYRLELERQEAVSDPEVMIQKADLGFRSGALTPNEIRQDYYGKELVKGDPAMDAHYLPLGVSPIGEAAMPPPPPPPAPAPAAGDPEEKPIPVKPDEGKAKAAGSRSQRRVLRFALARRVRMEKSLARVSRVFFRRQEDAVVARLLARKSAVTLDVGDVFDLASDERAWAKVTRTYFSSALKDEYTATAELFGYGETGPYLAGDSQYLRSLDVLATRVTRVSETTRAKLADVIRVGLDLGLSPQQIADGLPDGSYPGIRGTFRQFAQPRAQLIARTESGNVGQQASVALFQDLGETAVDILGCDDNEIVPGQEYGCNSVNVPIRDAFGIIFHPNHKGAPVPRSFSGEVRNAAALRAELAILTSSERAWDTPHAGRAERFADELEAGRSPEPEPAEVPA